MLLYKKNSIFFLRKSHYYNYNILLYKNTIIIDKIKTINKNMYKNIGYSDPSTYCDKQLFDSNMHTVFTKLYDRITFPINMFTVVYSKYINTNKIPMVLNRRGSTAFIGKLVTKGLHERIKKNYGKCLFLFYSKFSRKSHLFKLYTYDLFLYFKYLHSFFFKNTAFNLSFIFFIKNNFFFFMRGVSDNFKTTCSFTNCAFFYYILWKRAPCFLFHIKKKDKFRYKHRKRGSSKYETQLKTVDNIDRLRYGLIYYRFDYFFNSGRTIFDKFYIFFHRYLYSTESTTLYRIGMKAYDYIKLQESLNS